MNRRHFLNLPSLSEASESAAAETAAAETAAATATATAAPNAQGFGTNQLEAYNQKITVQDARHMTRRIGFGARPGLVAELVGTTGSQAAKLVLDRAESVPPLDSAYEEKFFENDADGDADMDLIGRAWAFRMAKYPYLEKIRLFWHNHFVVSRNEQGSGRYGLNHWKLMREHGLGNFKDFVYDIGITGAMLNYLDGEDNTKDSPNENYARELMELFTMGTHGPDGRRNYADPEDIQGIARAMSGWTTPNDYRPPEFRENRFYDGEKTFLGRTGYFDYDDAVQILFEERASQIAHFICRKLYCYFVFSVPNEAFVARLAQVFLDNDFEIRPVLEALLSSTHFHDPAFHGAMVKSPPQMIAGLVSELDYQQDLDHLHPDRLYDGMSRTGLRLFYYPNVSGWDGFNPPSSGGTPNYQSWYGVSQRSSIARGRLNAFIEGNETDEKPLQKDLMAWAEDHSDPENPFRMALDLAETLIPIPLEQAAFLGVDQPFSGDPSQPPPQEVLDDPVWTTLSKMLLDKTPHYEWNSMLNHEQRRQHLVEYVQALAYQVPAFFHC